MSEIIKPTEIQMKDLIPYLREAIEKRSGTYESVHLKLPEAQYVNSISLNGSVCGGRAWSRDVQIRFDLDKSWRNTQKLAIWHMDGERTTSEFEGNITLETLSKAKESYCNNGFCRSLRIPTIDEMDFLIHQIRG